MPVFRYLARSSSGEKFEGSLKAESQQLALQELDRTGYYPITISILEPSDKSPSRLLPRKKSVRKGDLALFYRQFADLLGGGLTVTNALEVLKEQNLRNPLHTVLDNLLIGVRNGSSLTEGMKRYPKTFSSLAINMVNAGETAGALEESLDRLSIFVERENELRSRIRSALAYPSLLAIVSFLTILALGWFVIPNLAKLFEEMEQALPLPTRIVIKFSELVGHYGWILVVGLLVFILTLTRHTVKTYIRSIWAKVGLRLPLVGDIILKVDLVSFCRTLASLLRNGVSILLSWRIACNAVQNSVLKKLLEDQQERIAKGHKIGESLAAVDLIPVMLTITISVGEEGNRLEPSLEKAADVYQREIDQRVKLLTSLLEPAMILVIGLVVGLIVISMMLPLLSLDIGGVR